MEETRKEPIDPELDAVLEGLLDMLPPISPQPVELYGGIGFVDDKGNSVSNGRMWVELEATKFQLEKAEEALAAKTLEVEHLRAQLEMEQLRKLIYKEKVHRLQEAAVTMYSNLGRSLKEVSPLIFQKEELLRDEEETPKPLQKELSNTVTEISFKQSQNMVELAKKLMSALKSYSKLKRTPALSGPGPFPGSPKTGCISQPDSAATVLAAQTKAAPSSSATSTSQRSAPTPPTDENRISKPSLSSSKQKVSKPKAKRIRTQSPQSIKRTASEAEAPKFNCDICGKLFDTRVKVNKHKKRCHREPDQMFMCAKCSKTFTAKEDHLTHYIQCSGTTQYVHLD